jgi:ParB family chromosome partitioning protein
MPNKIARPQLKDVDDLFDSMESTFIDTIKSVELAKLVPYQGYRFQLYEGERLEDMVESIRKNGVLVPITVRKIDSTLEILSGHNRANAAKIAGLEKIPAVILENLTDEEAWAYVVETNLIQRSFSEMAPSEKAAVIALYYSEMFSQGKRNDILEQIKLLEKSHNVEENGTSSQSGTKLRTDEKLGEKYGLSRNTIARYLRIDQLIPALKFRVDEDNIDIIPAVTLSFLKEAEQMLLEECLNKFDSKINKKKAELLRQFSEKNKLTEDTICKILAEKLTQKHNKMSAVKINKKTCEKYFKPEQSTKEIQKIINEALEMYFGQEKTKADKTIKEE